MKLNNIKIHSIEFFPYGGMIKSNMLINTNSIIVLIISFGGIIGQLLLFLIFNIFYKFSIIGLNSYNIFIKYNVYILLFNILPLYPLDGFKIMNSILEIFISFRKSIYVSLLINILFLILFIIYLFVFKINNFVIISFLVCNLIIYIKDIKYIINKFYVERIIYNIKYKEIISIKDIKFLYKNKYNYIDGIKEDIILREKYNR